MYLIFFVVLSQLSFVFGLRVAFLGDTGVREAGTRNFQQLREGDVELIVHNGDLDYMNDPLTWSEFLRDNWVDDNRAILVTSGNHELYAFHRVRGVYPSRMWHGDRQGEPGYQFRMHQLLQHQKKFKLATNCEGIKSGIPISVEDYGEIMSCTIHEPTWAGRPSMFVFMLGWEQLQVKRERQLALKVLEERLAATDAVWKVCSWHEPEAVVNPGIAYGGEFFGAAIEIMEACRKHGAIVMNGHSHVYARSKLVDGFDGKRLSISDNHDDADVKLSCGESFAMVNGIGGGSLYPSKVNGIGSLMKHADGYVKTFSKEEAKSLPIVNLGGAAICDFSEHKATCQFLLTGRDPANPDFPSTIELDRFTVYPPPRKCIKEELPSTNLKEELPSMNVKEPQPLLKYIYLALGVLLVRISWQLVQSKDFEKNNKDST